MIVAFLRHAEAEPNAASDFERRLTEKGHSQAEKVARFCERNQFIPDLLLTSPVVRARQTADIITATLKCSLQQVPWLACGMSVERCLSELDKLTDHRCVLLAGHEPDFSDTIAHILGMPNSTSLRIRKGSLTVLDYSANDNPRGQLQFLITPKYLSS